VASPASEPETVPAILVVEDSFAMRALEKSLFEAAGYRVETARDGQEALDRIATDFGIGVVVTDVEMRGMEGLELVRAIRDDPAHGSLPVIIVSARGSAEDRRRGLAAGADVYLPKGDFSQDALLDAVRDVLAERE